MKNMNTGQVGGNMNDDDKNLLINFSPLLVVAVIMMILLIANAKDQEPGRPNYYDSPVTEDTGERYG